MPLPQVMRLIDLSHLKWPKNRPGHADDKKRGGGWWNPSQCGISTVGSTSACQAEGRRFEPGMPLQIYAGVTQLVE